MIKKGDVIKSKYSNSIGMIVYVHPKEEPKFVIDYGDDWYGAYSDEVKLATPKQREAYIKKYGDRSK
jgi:uncharacterized protein YwgA